MVRVHEPPGIDPPCPTLDSVVLGPGEEEGGVVGPVGLLVGEAGGILLPTAPKRANNVRKNMARNNVAF